MNNDLNTLASIQRENQAAMRTEARTNHLLRAERLPKPGRTQATSPLVYWKQKLVLALAAGALLGLALGQVLVAAAGA
jgi:hypothetical protein